MKWMELVPSDFEKLAREESVCIVPMGSLERHGEHIPFGCDCVTVETISALAAEIEPAVVFPTFFFGQVHEASIFSGTINFPPEMLISMLRQTLNEIARNGFKKIIIFSGHGGNSDLLRLFDMATLEEKKDYTLYPIPSTEGILTPEETAQKLAILDTYYGHACEWETSLYMGCKPGLVKLEKQCYPEPIAPEKRMPDLPGVQSALWWYAECPRNVAGSPSLATEEKGKKLLDLYVNAFVRLLKKIKQDEVVPQMQKEFYERYDRVGK